MNFNARTLIFIRKNGRMTQQEVADKLAISERVIVRSKLESIQVRYQHEIQCKNLYIY